VAACVLGGLQGASGEHEADEVLVRAHVHGDGGQGYCAIPKEDFKEQPTPRNLSATARRVLQCTCPVAASRKYFSAIGALYCCQCSE